MPSYYQCNSCELTFSLGWYHYHSFENGYGASTNLVCVKCGTPHRVEIALRDRGKEYVYDWEIYIDEVAKDCRVKLLKYPRKLLSYDINQAKSVVEKLPLHLPGPIHEEEKQAIERELRNIGVNPRIEICEKRKSSMYGPIQQDRLESTENPMHANEVDWQWSEVPVLGERKGPCGEFELSSQSCCHCSSVGSLVAELPEEHNKCPSCNAESLVQEEGFVT